MDRAHEAYIDGGSRGNPGPAAIGVVILCPGGEKITIHERVGMATNNFAEYRALVRALGALLAMGARRARIKSDSELLVRQMRGEYKVKSPNIRPLFEQARGLASSFEELEFVLVPREENKEADGLVNKALDEQVGQRM